MSRFLFDQNLSPALITALSDIFPGCEHVSRVGLAAADDLVVWQYARDHQMVIVTKDADFSDLSFLHGFPPKVIWLRIGNGTTRGMEVAMRSRRQEIVAFCADQEAVLLTILKT